MAQLLSVRTRIHAPSGACCREISMDIGLERNSRRLREKHCESGRQGPLSSFPVVFVAADASRVCIRPNDQVWAAEDNIINEDYDASPMYEGNPEV